MRRAIYDTFEFRLKNSFEIYYLSNEHSLILYISSVHSWVKIEPLRACFNSSIREPFSTNMFSNKITSFLRKHVCKQTRDHSYWIQVFYGSSSFSRASNSRTIEYWTFHKHDSSSSSTSKFLYESSSNLKNEKARIKRVKLKSESVRFDSVRLHPT